MMMMFVFFMDKPEQASSRAMLGVGLAVFMVTIGTLAVILTFGPNLSSSFVSGLRFEPIHICHGVHSKCGYFDSYYLVLVFL